MRLCCCHPVLLVRAGLAAVATAAFTRLGKAAAASGSGMAGAAPGGVAAMQPIGSPDGAIDGEDDAEGHSAGRMDDTQKPATPAPSRAATPLAYPRLLFEQLRGTLCGSDRAAAAAAGRALPWLLQRFCVALRHHQAVAAAGA